MAKINARGAKEVARLASRSASGTRCLWILRSDGKVLRRIADGDLKSGYTIVGTLKKGSRVESDRELLASIVRKFGHEVTP